MAIICLAITFVAAGFLACAGTSFPARLLANATVTDDISPYTHDELVEMAVEIRDYSFGSHNAEALDAKMDQLLAQAQADGRAPQNARGEEYRLDAAAISHLDDCYHILEMVRIPLVVIAVLAIAAAAHVRVRISRKALGTVLVTTSAFLIAAFLVAGGAALMDFEGFFGQFHQLFFPQGNWVFWYRSLLICSLPEGFWMGMGTIWFATTLLLSILSIYVGLRLRKPRRRNNASSVRFNR